MASAGVEFLFDRHALRASQRATRLAVGAGTGAAQLALERGDHRVARFGRFGHLARLEGLDYVHVTNAIRAGAAGRLCRVIPGRSDAEDLQNGLSEALKAPTSNACPLAKMRHFLVYIKTRCAGERIVQ